MDANYGYSILILRCTDWYEQAVKSAKQYLEVMAFSRSGLIDQLEYEGYTHDQAVYGVDKAY